MGCTGFDIQPFDVSEAGLPDDVANDGGGDAIPKSYVVSTLAGTGDAGAADGPGLEATFSLPAGIAIGPDGSLYVTDIADNKIRKIAIDGTVSTYAGMGAQGLANGSCAEATFNMPCGITFDAVGNAYVADTSNNVIRKIDPTCQISTLAGSGKVGASDGLGTAASFYYPHGLTVDAAGNIYVADTSNNKIRKVDSNGNVSTFAGTGTSSYTDGPALNATFGDPMAIAADTIGTLYVGDGDDSYVRKITNGQVTTLAGGGGFGLRDGPGTFAAFNGPAGIAIDANGNLFVADSGNNAVRKISPAGVVATIAGGMLGADDGPADTASFNCPWGIAVDPNGVIYVTDSGNNKIRKITPEY